MTGVLMLPARLDLGSVSALAADLQNSCGADLTVDAGKVEHMGALSVQLLLAAQQRWAADGHCLTISPRSAAFEESLSVFGLADRFVEEDMK